MKALLLLNGEPYADELPRGVPAYCCDGAYAWAKGRADIVKNIGDFDSLKEPPVPPPEEIYPSEKNFTDGEIALRKMISDGVTEIDCYGAFGGRADHFLGNIQLLHFALLHGVSMRLISEDTEIFAVRGTFRAGEFEGKTVSVFPFSSPLHILDSGGMKYGYPKVIDYGECRGVSNIVLSPSAYVAFGEGCTALVIINLGSV